MSRVLRIRLTRVSESLISLGFGRCCATDRGINYGNKLGFIPLWCNANINLVVGIKTHFDNSFIVMFFITSLFKVHAFLVNCFSTKVHL
jgi:hypothetical protein